MAQQVYTIRMWDMAGAAGGTYPGGPGPPAGYVWVLRDARFFNNDRPNGQLTFPLHLVSSTGTMLLTSPEYSSITGIVYEWHGRAVLEEGETLFVSSNSLGWVLVVDGYQLSLP